MPSSWHGLPKKEVGIKCPEGAVKSEVMNGSSLTQRCASLLPFAPVLCQNAVLISDHAWYISEELTVTAMGSSGTIAGKVNMYTVTPGSERKDRIPDGLTVDHLCFVRNCVNIEHLELVDGVTNYLRGVEQRTHCRNGHLYPEDGIRGIRWRCQECEKANSVKAAESWRKTRSLSARRIPDPRIRFDQAQVEQAITNIQAGRITISDAAREIGCHPNYLGRRTWNSTKKIVVARDGGLCLRCGRQAEDVHHRIRRGMGSTRDPLVAYGIANCICLCRRCHDYIHSHPEESYAQGWLVHGWDDPSVVQLKHPETLTF